MLKKIILYGLTAAITLTFLFMLAIIIMFQFWKKNLDGQFDAPLVENVPTINMPIANNREAIIHAVHHKILEAPDYKMVNEPHEKPVQWSLSAFENENIWIVSLRTKGFLPTYSCIMKLNENAVITQEATCQYNK